MSDIPAVLVVDVQQSFLHASYWREDDVPAFRENHNAFTDTGLQAWLHDRGVDRGIVTGIRSEQCCETTARVASDLGFTVDYVTEATLTFPMVHAASGCRYDAQDIK